MRKPIGTRPTNGVHVPFFSGLSVKCPFSAAVRELSSNVSASSTTDVTTDLNLPRERLPRHIAVIMDGNGRWAERQKLPRIEGHRRGVTSVRRTVEECARLHIGQLTLYCLSSENWKRPQSELDFLMHLLEQYMIEERNTIMQNDIVVQIIGRRDNIPERVLREMDKTIEMSSKNTGTLLCLAINYGGRAEMVDAVQRIATRVRNGDLAVEDICETTIADHLYTAGMPDPDLLIRTAGEMRISNFLLWQISYAELWVTDLCWPEFCEKDLHDAIHAYATRDRRFGGLSRS
jgi:undecaprenyl diphosphate synthase